MRTVRAGEAVTRSRLVGSALLTGQPAGSRAVWLPAAGPESLTGIGPGQRVDVHVAGSPAPLLLGVTVLARTGSESAPSGLTATSGRTAAGLLVAVRAADAARVLAADVGESGAFRFALTGG